MHCSLEDAVGWLNIKTVYQAGYQVHLKSSWILSELHGYQLSLDKLVYILVHMQPNGMNLKLISKHCRT